ncbi:14-3-3 protein [Collybia nuda]|uniref:14-3-3 protein n=1 Tax=Collybia nuda TaxID=64659 RepID=A0A9P5Y6K1_9AGAR|nr:14-3-3 protein [Collybia nuda]
MAPSKARPTRSQLLFLADLAGEAGRHEDVIKQIKLIIELFDAQLTIDERNLLSIAYKNITNVLRNSWRTVDNIEKSQSSRQAMMPKQHILTRRQRQRIERELTNTCKDIVLLLDRQLLPAAKQGEEAVFYSKMKGDYYRYLAEFSQKKDRDRFADLSLNAYKLAYKHALTTLHPIHPTRLGLALNFAVFYHDVKKSPDRACHLAKSAFDDAILSLDSSDPTLDPVLRDSLTILQILRDDLILWSAEMQNTN